jgi:hypothetical protein
MLNLVNVSISIYSYTEREREEEERESESARARARASEDLVNVLRDILIDDYECISLLVYEALSY